MSAADKVKLDSLSTGSQPGNNGSDGERGSKWFTGTSLLHASGDFTVSQVAYIVNDMYLNTSTYNVYQCIAITSSESTWRYLCNIKGIQGLKGDNGTSAGFGTPTASYEGYNASKNGGKPHIEVTASGPDTAKVFNFKFWNLDNENGGGSTSDPVTYTPVFLTVS